MKLNYKRTLLVGMAFLSISAFWQLYDFSVPLILKDTYQLGDTASGAVMAMDNIVALFLLPLFGKLSDKCDTPIGKRMPFILGGTACAVILMNLLPVADKSDRIGFCFSYACEVASDGDAKLLHWTKQIQAPEIVGQWIGAELKKRLSFQPSKLLVLNDTVTTLLAGKASEKPGERFLRQLPEHIALVLLFVFSAQDSITAVFFCYTRIMSRSYIKDIHRIGQLPQQRPFQIIVTQRTGHWSMGCHVLINKVTDNLFAEQIAGIVHYMRDSQTTAKG